MCVSRISPTVLALLAVAAFAACPADGSGNPGDEIASPRVSDSPRDPEPTPSSRAPNILLIVTDDQRGGLSVMPKTRSVFRRRGVTFPDAYVTTPLCCPSRMTILTGRYAHNHGVRRNQEGRRAAGVRMIQQRLWKHGYRTAFFGKFLNSWNLEVAPPGFERWATTLNDTYYDGTWNINGEMRTIPTYSTTYLRQRATNYLRASEDKDDRPWMMVLSTPAPHGPQTPERRYATSPVPAWNGNPATRDSDLSDKPGYVRNETDAFGEPVGVRDAQLRTLLSVDDMVGETFRAMRELNEVRRTLAIFISDNGMLWGEFGMTGKTHAYTPSIRVPMMVRWSGHLEGGAVDRRMVANVDIVPTILDAVGLPQRGTDGSSLLSDERRGRLLLEHWRSRSFSTPSWNSLRSKRFQYVEYYRRDGEIAFQEYFDLRRDPWQLDNILVDARPRNDPDVERLSQQVRKLSRCRGASCP